MIGVLAIFLGAGAAAGGAVGFGVYEVFSHIMPRETGVPLGCVFGTLAGIYAAGTVIAKMAEGTEFP